MQRIVRILRLLTQLSLVLLLLGMAMVLLLEASSMKRWLRLVLMRSVVHKRLLLAAHHRHGGEFWKDVLMLRMLMRFYKMGLLLVLLRHVAVE